MPLVGKQVMLRALELRDLDAIWDAYKDFDMQLETDGDAPPLSDRQVQDFWMQRIIDPAPDMRYFTIEPLEGCPGAGQFVGMITLQDIDMRNRHAELGIWLSTAEKRGHGYGTDAVQTLLPYAFEVTRLEKLTLGVYDFNEAGLRCYERVGFRYEGRLQHQIYYRGRYWDEWPMRILAREWDVIKQPPAEGVRLYHPADQDQVVALIQRALALPGPEEARAVLRGWWRRIDHDLYCHQREGQVMGLLAAPLDGNPHSLFEIAALVETRPSVLTAAS